MTDFEMYKNLLDKSNTRYFLEQNEINYIVSVQDDNVAFYMYFDILTEEITDSELNCFVYSE